MMLHKSTRVALGFTCRRPSRTPARRALTLMASGTFTTLSVGSSRCASAALVQSVMNRVGGAGPSALPDAPKVTRSRTTGRAVSKALPAGSHRRAAAAVVRSAKIRWAVRRMAYLLAFGKNNGWPSIL